MVTIQQTVDISAGHKLAIDIPPEVPAGTEKAALKVIQAEQIRALLRNDNPALRRYTNRAQDLREARIAIALRYGKPHDDQSYAKHAGCLKDSGVFAGDSAAIQEEMRREWT